MGAQPSARLNGQVPDGWLPLSHAECLSLLPGVRLEALCDLDENTVTAAARQYQGAAGFTDYEHLLREKRPALLAIATRTPAKAAIIEGAVAAGVRGIYIEKPLATNIHDSRRLLELLSASGVKIAYGVNRRYHATYRRARQLAAEGVVGEIGSIVVEHGLAPLLWSHPHAMDLILFLSGASRAVEVQATLAERSFLRQEPLLVDSDPEIESAFFRMNNGVTAAVTTTRGLNVRIAGAKGNLTVHADGAFLQIDREGGPPRGYFMAHEFLQPEHSTSATIMAMTELAKAVRDGGDGPIPPAAIASGTEMLLGCAWSHIQRGRRVIVEEIPVDLVVSGRSAGFYA